MGRDRRSEASSSSKSKADRNDRKSESSSRRDNRRSRDRPSSEHDDDHRKLDRTTSWDREGEPAEGKRKDKSSKKMSRSKTMNEYSTESGLNRAAEDGGSGGGMTMGMEGSGHFSAQVNAPGFNPFPGQNDPGAGLPAGIEHGDPAPATSSHVQDQFPGQNPGTFTAPYRPPISANEGGPGLAADYYGDQGESVATQPGVRPQGPSVIVGAQPHLVAASSAPAPPMETGSGSAQDYFGGGSDYQNAQANEHHPLSKPSRPSKLGKHDTVSGVVAASAGAALGYAAGHGTAAGSQTSVLANTSQTELASIHGDMASAPEVPTLGSISGGLDGKHHHSNAGMYAAGAAGLAAGAYALGHSGQHDKPSSGTQLPTYSKVNAPHSSQPHEHAYVGAMAMRDAEKGPLRRFVDWWKDYEDVRKMEEYTEYIGVCRGCFDPGTSAIDAPRKHRYHGRRRRRRSNGHRPSRVEKGSRYGSSSSSSSSDSDGGGNAAAWIGTAAAGYGLTKLGKAFFKGDDSDSDRKGKRKYNNKSSHEHRQGHSSHSIDGRRRRRTSSLDGRSSYGIQTVTKRRSRSQDLASGEVIVDAKQQKFIRRRRSRSSSGSTSRSSSSSADGRSALVAAGVGVAGAAAAASYLGSSNRQKGSESPGAVLVRKRSSERKGRRSPTSFDFHADGSSAYRSSRHSGSSRYDVSYNAADSHGHVGGSTAVVVKKKRSKRKSKSNGGFSFFGNASTSSLSDDGLAFGAELSRKRRTKRKSSDEKLNAALVGLGATAGALAVAQARNSKPKPKTSNIYVGAQERRGYDKRRDSDREDGWESASDDDDSVSTVSSCSSGAESALAFGDAIYGMKDSIARKSQDSLVSDSSGTDKWGWRWGSKKKKKKRVIAGSAVATAAVSAAIGGAVNSTSNPPPMQHVHPVQTSDPTRFETSRRAPSVSSVQAPLITAIRPEPTSVQPQPVRPVSNAVFTTEASVHHPGYTVTSGPPYQQFPALENLNSEQQIPGPGHMRHSSTFPVEDSRDQAMASKRPESTRRRSSPTSISVARNTALAGVAAGSVVSVLSNGKKKDRSSSAGVRFHDVKGDGYQEERNDEESDSRRERRRHRDEARQERLRREDERERLRQMRREETERRRKVEEITDREEDRSKEMTVTDQKIVKSDSSHAPVGAAVAGGAMIAAIGVTATALAANPAEVANKKFIHTVEIVPDQSITLNEETKSAIFDPDYFKKRDEEKRQASLRRRPSADEIVADLEQRYQAKPQSMASFFAPPELLDQSSNLPSHVKPVVVPSFEGDRNIHPFDAPAIVTIEPPEGTASSFNVSRGNVDINRIAPPWGVPMLNLIEPTPPASRTGSVFSQLSSPASPASFSDESVKNSDIEEQCENVTEIVHGDAKDDVHSNTSRSASINWGNSQTMILEGDAGQVGIIEDKQPNSQSATKGTKHDFKDTVLGEVVEEVIGDTTTVGEDEIIRSTSPEVEPIVIEPEDDEDKSSAIPASIVFEAMTGFGSEGVQDEQSGQREGGGYVEGEINEEPDLSIPGGFNDDASLDTKPIDMKTMVVEPVRDDDDDDYEKLSKKESVEDDYSGFSLGKKKKQKKKKDKGAQRQNKDPAEREVFAEENSAEQDGVQQGVVTEDNDAPVDDKGAEVNEATVDDNLTDVNVDPSNEWESLPGKKSKKAKNRKNMKKGVKVELEAQQSQQSIMSPVMSAAVDGVLPGDNKTLDDSTAHKEEDEKENAPRSLDSEPENAEEKGNVDNDGDGFRNFSISKKKSKKNKKGKSAKSANEDDWIEPAANTEPYVTEVAEPGVLAGMDNHKDSDTPTFIPTSKKDKKKAKQKNKWASILSAVGVAAPAETVDDKFIDGEREIGGLGEGKDLFYDSRDELQAKVGLNEGTGTRRRDDDGKVLDLPLSSMAS